MAVEILFRLLEPWPVKIVLDSVSHSLGANLRRSPLSVEASAEVLLLCAGAVIVISLIRAVAGYVSAISFALVGTRISSELRARTFRHLQGLSMRHHSRASTGDTVQRLVGDVSRLQDVAVTAGLPLIGNIVSLIAMMIIMLWLDPLIALVTFVSIGIFVLLSRKSSGSITTAARKSRKGESALATTAAQTLGAMREVQAYGLEDTISSGFSKSNQAALGSGVATLRLAASLQRKTDVLTGIATAVVLAAGGWRVMQHAMTPGDLVVFLSYLKTGLRPLKDVARYTSRIARATASGERVADLLEAQSDVPEAPHAVALKNPHPDIVFDDVWAGHFDGNRGAQGDHPDHTGGSALRRAGALRGREVHAGKHDPSDGGPLGGECQPRRRGPAGPEDRFRACPCLNPAPGLRAVRNLRPGEHQVRPPRCHR